MGYMLTFVAAPLAELRERLHAPDDRSGPAAALADLIAAGGGTPDEEQIEVLAAALAELGEPVEGVDHSSSSGEWFRDDVVAGPVAQRFGAELAGHLVERPLDGLVWPEFPSVGWATNAELRAALEHGTDDDLADDDPETEETARIIADAVAGVAASGRDLVTLYA